MSGTEPVTPVTDGKPEVPALDASNLAKSFGASRALKGVDLTVGAGEVVALLGENGSGKSTLVKILAGYHQPEPGGELRMNGIEVPLPVPLGESRAIGLAFVYQDLGLANDLQVVENLFVGHRVATGLRSSTKPIRWGAERERARAIFERYQVKLEPSALVGRLRPTSQALLAIVRAAEELREYREQHEKTGGVLVLDEPTVFLPQHEKVFLYDLVRRVASDGIGVLFVSHDMTAVREIANRAVVLRDGEKVGDVRLSEASDADLIQLVSGHRISRETIEAATNYKQEEAAVVQDAEIVLSVTGVTGGRLHGVDLNVHAGEILGVAGLLGSGSEDLPYALFGDISGSTGHVRIGDWETEVSQISPRSAREHGAALVPGDRKQQGVVAELPVATNMLSLSFKNFMQGGILRHGKLRSVASERSHTYDVRPRNVTLNMASLSGGNQQKVVLARWLEQSPKLLLLHEPTQGVDVATRHEIYELMRERAREGVAILWVSTDFDELATVAHRIVLCSSGVIAGTIRPPFSRDRITSEVYGAAARLGQREVSKAS
jgi:ribose transport system ATP-binding protein